MSFSSIVKGSKRGFGRSDDETDEKETKAKKLEHR